MYDDSPRSDGGNATAKIAIIIGAVVLGVVLVCGGVTYLVVKAVSKVGEEFTKSIGEAVKNLEASMSESAADAFLDDVRNGQFDDAYLNTTAEFQKTLPKEKLQALVAKYPFLKAKNEDDTLPLTLVHKGTVEHRYEATSESGRKKRATKVTIVVRKVGEEWKIDRFTVGDEPQAKEP
jgi:hypothetical protein